VLLMHAVGGRMGGRDHRDPHSGPLPG